MLANAYDLPLRGNYFAEAEYLEQDLNAGTLRNRAGARVVALTDECLVAVHNAIAEQFGGRSDAVLSAVGRDWGRRAGEQFAAEMAHHRERPLADLPLAVFAADLTAAFLHHGWGRVELDFDRFSRGILGVNVYDPVLGSVVKRGESVGEPLLAGFLAGMFSDLSGTDLDCLQTECRAGGAAASRFLLTVPERVAAVAALAVERKPHAEILAELEQTKAR
jgi:predicted hydrocarbon binding protein